MARSFRPLQFAVAVVVVAAVSLSLTGCVADPPPLIGTVSGGDGVATVSWQPPPAFPAPISSYVVTPWVGSAMQTPVRYDSTATTQIVAGLTNGVSYTFTVHAINALGNDSAESAMSNPTIPGPQIALSPFHSCAIVAGEAVDCWGYNGSGQLGDGTTTQRLSPVPVGGLTGAIAIATGTAHTCALLAAQTVDCWGGNSRGQLGNGTTTNSLAPVQVSGLTGVTAIAAENAQTCALVTGGVVYCWGLNGSGQLGNGTTIDSSTPVPVAGLTDAVAIASGTSHTCAVKSDGTVYCWGDNFYAQLGSGSPGLLTPVPTPVQANVSGAIAVTAGMQHTCALLSSGSVMCWGYNGWGELGSGTFTGWVPVTVTGLTGATQITAGNDHTCAVVADGATECWGHNNWGQLGNGTSTDCDPGDPTCHPGVPTPVAVTGLTDVIALSGGQQQACALIAGGAGYCWGENMHGQLGNGTTATSLVPVAVAWP